jgi:hypothetical protein
LQLRLPLRLPGEAVARSIRLWRMDERATRDRVGGEATVAGIARGQYAHRTQSEAIGSSGRRAIRSELWRVRDGRLRGPNPTTAIRARSRAERRLGDS